MAGGGVGVKMGGDISLGGDFWGDRTSLYGSPGDCAGLDESLLFKSRWLTGGLMSSLVFDKERERPEFGVSCGLNDLKDLTA